MARLRIAKALSSSLYMRKRLPQPKARIETFAPVRPRVREGIGSVVGRALAASLSSKRLVPAAVRSEEHTSELQSQSNLVCRLLLEKKQRQLCEHTCPTNH